DFAGPLRSLCYVVNLNCLNVHAADENEIGPSEIGCGCFADILIDEPYRPCRREVRGNQEQPLRWHKRTDPRQPTISMGKNTERGGIGGKYAKNSPPLKYRRRITHLASPNSSSTLR